MNLHPYLDLSIVTVIYKHLFNVIIIILIITLSRFSCVPGFSLIGTSLVTCLGERTWNLPFPPVCLSTIAMMSIADGDPDASLDDHEDIPYTKHLQ